MAPGTRGSQAPSRAPSQGNEKECDIMSTTNGKISKKNMQNNEEVSIRIETGKEGILGKIHGLSEAFNPPKKPRDPRTPEVKNMEDFFEAKVGNISKFWSPRLGRLMLSTLRDFLKSKEFQITREVRWTGWGQIEEAPSLELVDLGEGKSREVIKDGQLYVTTPRGRMIFAAETDSDNDVRLRISFPSSCKENQGFAKEYLAQFIEYAWENSPLRGKAWQADFSWIHRTGKIVQPFLTDSVNQKLQLHAHTFIENLANLERLGLKSSRGILLSGPPGCGKTMVIKSMIEKYDDLTFIVLTSEHLQRQCVRQIYDIARRLAPSVVILEDIDSAGGLSRKVSSHPILGEVLQALNGVSENKGVFTIATTNFIEDLDDALRDRPGRFDVILTIDLPDSDARFPMIEELCKKHDFEISESQLANFVQRTENFSGAWLAEVFESTKLVALSRGREELYWDDILTAIEDIQDRRRVAYQKTPSLPPPPSNESMRGSSYA